MIANYIFKILTIRSSPWFTTGMTTVDGNRCHRFVGVLGLEDRRNDIVYCSPSTSTHKENSVVVYFGGDIQDYRERMEKHRDNRRFADERSLEATALLLSRKFPASSIVVVKPNQMYLGSFACYSNFLPCNNIGAPSCDPPIDHRAWDHLKLLLDNVRQSTTPPRDFSSADVILVGFSKGAVVLNQFVYELSNVTRGSNADGLVERIRAWYWLDGAHAGSKKTWITDQRALELFADRANANRSRVFIHVTPRQVRDPGRPWVGEEESKFSRILSRLLGDRVFRKLHFEDEPPSMENHFRVLDVFEPDSMCGICLVLVDASSALAPPCKEVFSTWLQDVGLKESLCRRGPDNLDHHLRQVDSGHFLYGAASVLHVRGAGGQVTQPMVDRNGSFLLFNGEIYDGLPGLKPNDSDTVLLFGQLNLVSAANDGMIMVNFISGLQGPFSIIYFDGVHRRLWFCRDAFGRRSLLYGVDHNSSRGPSLKFKLILSSIAAVSPNQSSGRVDAKWRDLPAGHVFCLDFGSPDEELTSYELRPSLSIDDLVAFQSNFRHSRLIELNDTAWTGLFQLNRFSDPRWNLEASVDDDQFEHWYLDHFDTDLNLFLSELRTAVRKRLSFASNFCRLCQLNGDQTDCPHSRIALLFSGGVDSLLLAILIAEEFGGRPVDLLNVAFGSESDSAPDRVTGSAAFSELVRLHPERVCDWKFVKIDVARSDLSSWRKRRIAQLVLPSDTVLDDSIGCVLWFAARGVGFAASTDGTTSQASYTSPCRILFVGTGADELLAGYSRHRKRYFDVHERDRNTALIEELEMELKRIGNRNLARDDRVVADHGRETRLPYLDERFVQRVNALPLDAKADLRRGRGIGEKLLLRMALKRLGVLPEFYRLPKRAMQFGSRIAKTENRKEKGGDRCERLLDNFDTTEF